MKPGGQYRKGANAERWLCKWYLRHGALHAMRTAGSHSGFDVIALFRDHTEVVQLKAGRYPSKEDINKFHKDAKEIYASPFLVHLERGHITVVAGTKWSQHYCPLIDDPNEHLLLSSSRLKR